MTKVAQHVQVVDYRPAWFGMFRGEAERLRGAVGEVFEHIEHIGSTSVPGLAAKPVIDMMPGVASIKAFDAGDTRGRIVALGYDYREDLEAAMPYRRYFTLTGENAEHPKGHLYHVHIVEVGSEFWVRHLVFRDYLRTHPAERRAYGEFKQRIAPGYTSTEGYSEAKHEFIQSLQLKALDWYAKAKRDAD